MRKNSPQRRGIAFIWLAVFAVVFVGFIGLALDTSWLVLVNHQLQNAADASSLAAARVVTTDQAEARIIARNIAAANLAGSNFDGSGLASVQLDLNVDNDPAGDIVLGYWDDDALTFTPTTEGPNAVKVNAPRVTGSLAGAQPLLFGSGFNQPTANASRSAIAIADVGLGAGLLVLDPTGSCALTVQGNGDVTVIDGSIQVNSTHANAACSNGGPTITAGEINITGGENFGGNTTINGPVNTGEPPIPDPLIDLPAPPTGPIRTIPTDGSNYEPGWYQNGINFGPGIHNMNSGVYYLGGGGGTQDGFRANANSVISCASCMFYIASGSVDINGGAEINISASEDVNDTYWHITFFQSRTNTTSGTINGGADNDLTGTLYFPNNHMTLNGGTPNDGVQLIVFRLTLSGNNILYLLYDGAFTIPAPGRVFLVQ